MIFSQFPTSLDELLFEPARRWRGATIVMWSLASVLAWLAVAVLMSAQAHLVAAWQGHGQAWWPSFGYSAAIFSIWAMLTPPLIEAVALVERRLPTQSARGMIYLGALPCTVALHVFLFAAIFWPFYSDGGRIASRWAMGAAMFRQNFQSDTVIYLAVVGMAALRARGQRRDELNAMPSGARPPITVSVRGGKRFVSSEEIHWIRALDGYAELHGADMSWLADDTLAALEHRLADKPFIRVHRAAIVRLDQIVEMRSIGHGDAMLVLRGGAQVRLSRRYRARVVEWLSSGNPFRLG